MYGARASASENMLKAMRTLEAGKVYGSAFQNPNMA